MLHGLLLVLKIAGIILAVLLGIVLAAAAAVLFVPGRDTACLLYTHPPADQRSRVELGCRLLHKKTNTPA